MKIVTGSTGTAHVTSNNAGEFHQAIFGAGNMVFTLGNALEATLVDNNNITIADGDLLIQGRHALIEPGLTENVGIETGSLGVNRHDLISARYQLDTDTGYESISLVVIKGEESSGSATDPSYITGDIRTGSTIVDFPLYRVEIEGINIVNIEALFEAVPPLESRNRNLSELADVNVSTPTDEDVFTYNSVSGKWENTSTSVTTVTNNPISVTMQSVRVARNTNIALEPIQASGTPTPSAPIPISGYTQIDLKGTGKNLVPATLSSIKALNTTGTWSGNAYTLNGVTFTVNTNADGYITSVDLSGTASAQTEFSLVEGSSGFKLNAGTYFISGVPVGSTTIWLNTICAKSTSGYWIDRRVDSNGFAATVGENDRPYSFRIRAGATFTGSATVYPMIEVGATGTAFEPYEKGTDISLPLPSTIYGGSLNVETGVLTVDRGIVDLGDLEWTYDSGSQRFHALVSGMKVQTSVSNAVCTSYEVVDGNFQSLSDLQATANITGFASSPRIIVRDTSYTDAAAFKTAVTGQKFVYELATPYEIQLTPQQVSLLQGANVITSNGTTIALTYREGEIATLADVESLAETINRTAEIADGTKSADKITAGTLQGRVKANPTAMANLGMAQVRDIYFSDTEVVIGSVSTDPEGSIRITFR